MADARKGAETSRRGWDLVLEVVRLHGASLLRVARRHSLCADDAQDAYQRSLEIFLRRAESLEASTSVGWLRTVIKHEAMAVRALRQSTVSAGEVDPDLEQAVDVPTTDEHIARFDRLTRSAEALQRCKPHEARALLLKAQGHSYAEICSITGWTYTKVNRCLTEGRKRFIERYEGIESGAECGRWTSVLSAMADGEASARQLMEVRPHLRNCAGCRATVRAFHAAPFHVGTVFPVALSSAAQAPHGTVGFLVRMHDAVAGGLHERAALSAEKLQSAFAAGTAGKVAAVAASAAALAGGGVAVQDALDHRSSVVRGSAAEEHRHGHRRLVAKVKLRSAAYESAPTPVRAPSAHSARARPAARAAPSVAPRPSADRSTSPAPLEGGGEFGFEQPATSASRPTSGSGATSAGSGGSTTRQAPRASTSSSSASSEGSTTEFGP